MSRISIIFPTMRIGGMDVVFHGLSCQTFHDFELIIVDNLYKYRKELLAEKSKNYFFPVKHMEPINNKFPLNSYCHSMNSGLMEADSELVLFLVDYTWLPPACLENHYNAHAQNQFTVSMCPHVSLQHPGLTRNFNYRSSSDNYTFEGIDKYVADLESGGLNDLMWSIFADFKDPLFYPEETRFGRDTKIDYPLGPVDHLLLYLRNESVRLEHMTKIHGFDEDFDGSHGYQDSDVADRLHNLGLGFVNNPTNVNYIINPRPIFPHGKRIRSIESNSAIWKLKKSGTGTVNSPIR